MTGWAFWIVVGLGAYGALIVALRLVSRGLLFRPWRFLIEPRLCPVEGVELVDIHPSDGELLYLWHLPPKRPDAPVLVYFDGNRGNIAIWTRRWKRIAEAGAGFIALSYRGYGGSTLHPSEAGLHKDAEQAWQWAMQTYPETRLVAHGYSLGSGLAARIGANHSPRAVVLEAPYTSIVNRAQEMFPLFPAGLILRDRFETWREIGEIHAPILIVHGQKDRIVPDRHGKTLYRLAHEPKQFVSVPKANHVNLTAHGLYDVIWQFLCFTPDAPPEQRLHTPNTIQSHGREMRRIKKLSSTPPTDQTPHSIRRKKPQE